MADPVVSIVTAAYNAAPYIEETIESVLGQDYPRLEYIVLDDGSTDETPKLLRRYENRLRLEHHPNMGEALTVNKGFALSTGELVGVVSADDPLLPGIVSAMVERFGSDPDVLVVYPDWEMIDDDGNVIKLIETFEYSYRNMIRWHHCIPGPGTFIRRSVVDELGGRDTTFRYVGDLDFWFHAGLLGPFARLPKTLARYRHHAASASVGQLGERMAREHILVTDKLFAREDLPSEIRRVRREAYSSAHWVAGVVAGASQLKLRRRHFRRALRYAPLKYLGEYRRSRLFVIVLPTFVPGRVDAPVRAIAHAKLYARVARGRTVAYARLYTRVLRGKLRRLRRA